MKTIYKYPIEQEVRMPKGASIIKVGMQHGSLMMWAKVDTGAELQTRTFDIVGTGQELEDKHTLHLGTVLTANDRLVWHIFETTQFGLIPACDDATTLTAKAGTYGIN